MVPTALADDKIAVQAGDTRQIATSDKPIKNTSGPLKGTVSVPESSGTPPIYTLLYVTLKETSDMTDVIKKRMLPRVVGVVNDNSVDHDGLGIGIRLESLLRAAEAQRGGTPSRGGT